MPRLFIVLAGLFTPSELVWTMGASGLFKSILGGNYFVLTPQFLIPLFLLIYFLLSKLKVKTDLLIVYIAFLSIGLFDFLATRIGGGNRDWAFQQLIFGFIGPVLLGCALSQTSENLRVLYFEWFYIGYIIYLTFAFIFLLYDGIFFDLYQSYGIGGALVAFRFQIDQANYFSLILGNANKQSNYLLLCILLGPVLLNLSPAFVESQHVRKSKTYRIFVVVSSMVLFAFFSRAVIFLLPVALYLNRNYLFKNAKMMIYILVLFSLPLALIFYDVIEPLFNYLIFSQYIDGASEGILGTMIVRFNQLSQIFELVSSDPGILLHGLGVGSYGKILECDECGSHNLFFDHLLNSGLYGLVVLAAIVISGIVRTMVNRDFQLTIIYIIFIFIAVREYSFSYLYVTSLGGLLFIFIVYLTYRTRNLNSSKKAYVVI